MSEGSSPIRPQMAPVRLVFQLSNTADKDRRILFTGPRTTLIDELGNVLVAAGNRWYRSLPQPRRLAYRHGLVR